MKCAYERRVRSWGRSLCPGAGLRAANWLEWQGFCLAQPVIRRNCRKPAEQPGKQACAVRAWIPPGQNKVLVCFQPGRRALGVVDADLAKFVWRNRRERARLAGPGGEHVVHQCQVQPMNIAGG